MESDPTTGPVDAGRGIVPDHPPVGDGAVDATREKDRALIRQSLRKWPRQWSGIDDAKKQKWMEQLEYAGDVARSVAGEAIEVGSKLDAAKVIVSAAKTFVSMVGQNQADEHLQTKIENPAEVNVNVSEVRRVVIDVAGLDADRQGVLAHLAGGPGATKKLPPQPPIEGQAGGVA
jgi:hypothetical protein